MTCVNWLSRCSLPSSLLSVKSVSLISIFLLIKLLACASLPKQELGIRIYKMLGTLKKLWVMRDSKHILLC